MIELTPAINEIKLKLKSISPNVNLGTVMTPSGGGSSVPTEVRQAIYTLLDNAAYATTGLEDEIAIVQAWAQEVTSISLIPSSLSLNKNTPQTIVANVIPSGSTVTWTSSDNSIATVNDGVVTGVNNGSCVITATAGDKSANCSVTVSGFATLVSISAVYTQSGTVYDTDTLDSLKNDLVVTATYDDSSTETVPGTDYTLSGTLTTGTSTIAVLYGGKSATFTVTVTHATTQYTITNTLSHVTNSNNATTINEESSYSATLTAASGYVISSVVITMGGNDITSSAYNSSDGSITISSATGNIVITASAVEDVGWISGVPYVNNDIGWTLYKVIDSSGDFVSGGNYYATEQYVPCHGATAIKYETNGSISGQHARAFYDENYNLISNSFTNTFYTDVGENHIVVPEGAYYFRITVPKAEYEAGATLTPYLYETITENTVWVSGTIYKTVKEQLGLCFGATQVKMLVDAGIYGYRGYYSLFDSNKQRTNSMGNTNNFTRTPFSVSSSDYYFSLSVGNVLVKIT